MNKKSNKYIYSMINLQTGDNTVVVTLYEKSQNLFNPQYTWQIVNKTTKDTTYFYAVDNSVAPYYWNSFTISVASQSGLTAGIINNPAGEYEYTVYEMPDAYNLNIASASGIVEVGILKIAGTANGIDDLTTFTYSGTIPAFKNI